MVEDISQRSRTTPDWDPHFDRLFYANAAEVDVDSVGRILVPEKLKKWAGLTKNVLFAGVGNRIEIWDADRWNAEEEKRVESFLKVGKSVLNRS